MNRLKYLFATLLFCLPLTATAEDYCVHDVTELRSALVGAANSSAASVIRIRKGFYTVPVLNGNPISLQYTGSSDLEMSGGWDGGNGSCSDGFGLPEQTVLSADGTGVLLRLFLPSGAEPTITLTRISFRQGAGSSAVGAGCVSVESTTGSGGSVFITRNSFRLCSQNNGNSSALSVSANSLDVYIRNNVFTDNAGVNAAVNLRGVGNSIFYVSNNTLANNPQVGGGGGVGGMQILGQATDFYWFSNNVLWNNGSGSGFDLQVATGTPIVLNSNLIGDVPALPPGVVNNNTLSVDPRFTNSVNFLQRADSPLRNSGVNPPGGTAFSDFAGLSRVSGGRIDRGAYEFQEIFSNDFE